MNDSSKQRLLITVHDVHTVEGRGTALAGTDEHLGGLTDDELRGLAGWQVELRVPGEEHRQLDISAVETSTSLAGRRNVFFLVAEGAVDASAIGGEVWTAA